MNIEYKVEDFSLRSEKVYMDVKVDMDGFIELALAEGKGFPICSLEELDFVYSKLKEALQSVNNTNEETL